MHFLKIATIMAFATTTALATPIDDGVDSQLDSRGVLAFIGRCTELGRVTNSNNEYVCRNSYCSEQNIVDHVKVTIAPNEKGKYVAKCPMNLLSYEWQWPPA